MYSRGPIQRLSNYRRVLVKLKALGFVRFVSDNLGGALDITPSQVRKDFATYNLASGNKKGGYEVEDVLGHLNEILGKNEIENIIVVGCGGLGRTLMRYNVSGEGMKIVAGFDSDYSKVDPEAIIPVYRIGKMKDFIKTENIRTAILSVPEPAASPTADTLKQCGIRGILNFAPIVLKSSEACYIRNINIIHELENIIYFAKQLQEL